MSKGKILGALLTLVASATIVSPAMAQYYYPNTVVVNPGFGPGYYGPPCYNNYACRGYNPYWYHGYHRWRTERNMAIGAGIGSGVGAAIGLLASHHGHHYYY